MCTIIQASLAISSCIWRHQPQRSKLGLFFIIFLLTFVFSHWLYQYVSIAKETGAADILTNNAWRRLYLKSNVARIHNPTEYLLQVSLFNESTVGPSRPEDEGTNELEVFGLNRSDNGHLRTRAMEYCNRGSPYGGKEGEVPAAYTLLSVIVVLRHGDRAPMYTIPGVITPHLSCRLDTTGDDTTRNFMRKMDAFRAKSSRTSIFRQYSMYPNSSMCGVASLTPAGIEQMLRMGAYLRSRYTDRHNLFRSNVTRTKQMYVRITEFSRTLQSATAFLYGFHPFVDLRSVTIETTRNIHFCRSRPNVICVCPAVQHAYGASKRSSRRRGSHNRTLENNIRRTIARLLNVSSTALPWTGAIVEVLMTYKCHGRKVPCVGRSNHCLTNKHLNTLWDVLDSSGLADASYYEELASRLQMHPFLLEIVSSLSEAAASGKLGGRFRRFSLYLGHDLTLSALLKALGIHDGRWPPYASRLVFELYGRKPDQTYIRVLYNGQDLTQALRFCHYENEGDAMCPFSDFVQFVRVENLRFFKNLSYHDACKLTG